MTIRSAWLVFVFTALSCGGAPHPVEGPAAGQPAKGQVVLSQAVAPLDGERIRATLVEISHEPGGSAPAHSHPCPVLVYVLEGAVRIQLNDEPETTYRAGQAFYEAAGGIHQVSANASKDVPAKILAMFLCDRETPYTVPVPGTGSPS